MDPGGDDNGGDERGEGLGAVLGGAGVPRVLRGKVTEQVERDGAGSVLTGSEEYGSCKPLDGW